jgi:hypothetical protein
MALECPMNFLQSSQKVHFHSELIHSLLTRVLIVYRTMYGMGTTSRFLEGFLKSWGVILASEIGDKTFFIAAVMAMKNSRREV